MTYAFGSGNWPAFQHELRARGIAVSDIERVEIRPRTVQSAADVSAGMIDVTVTVRSGRVETWSQQQAEVA